jgi:hypothetical protein
MNAVSSAPPWYYCHDPGLEWLSVGQFAKRWNKNRRTILRWCESGFILSLGMQTFRDQNGYWYICIRRDM